MTAVDPTYPAYPIACTLATVMMLLILATSFVRQSWNLGVTLLSAWLCLENLICAIDAIVWSDNAEAKLYVWCDITSRLNTAILVGINIAPLLITRRLYRIADLRSVTTANRSARIWDRAVDWTWGLLWPLVSAGPLYYIVQDVRFEVIEGFGCFKAHQYFPQITELLRCTEMLMASGTSAP